MDPAELKRMQSTMWGKGEYTSLSGWLRPASVELCDACAVSAGQEVLDAAAGDGNFAIASAREGAAVVACDIAPGMVERGRKRSADEGYDIEWLEGDVEELPFEDARFDCVGSAFGAFIAPQPRVAAEELFRVVRPGGTVGMTAWVPGSFVPRLGEISRNYAARPNDPDQHLGEEWGVEENVRERFQGLAGTITAEVRTLVMQDDSLADLTDHHLNTPPMAAAREAMPPDAYEPYIEEVRALVREHSDESGRMESDYMLIVARKPG